MSKTYDFETKKYTWYKPHSLDLIYIVHLTEVHWWTERVPNFIQKFNEGELGVDPRIPWYDQIFLCWYEDQAREIVKAIEDGQKVEDWKERPTNPPVTINQ